MAKNLTLKQRIRLFWLHGYPDPRIAEDYMKSVRNIAEQQPSSLERIVEQQNVNKKARGKTIETATREHVLTSQAPSKEDLNLLKQALGISKGTLVFKPRGQGIYHVTYDPDTKRRPWKHLGTYQVLKHEAELKAKAVIPAPIP